MTAVNDQILTVGMRHYRIYELNAAGLPDAASTTAYEGAQVSGARAYNLNAPGPRRISHYGDDHVLDIDQLPPTEGISAEVRTQPIDFAADAIFSGISTITVGEARERAIGHDKEGEEVQVGLLMFQQGLDASSGSDKGERRWYATMFPKALVRRRGRGMGEGAQETIYDVTPQVVTQRVWGDTLESATDGFAQAQLFEYITEGKPHIVAWKAGAATTEYIFPSDKPATATGKVHAVTDDGTVVSPTTTLTTAIQFNATDKPAENSIVVAFYEY
jgi:hypothetical protein